MLTRLIAAFTFRDYRILWVMLIIGSIAFWMRILGTAQWLLEETGSAYMVGLIGVVKRYCIGATGHHKPLSVRLYRLQRYPLSRKSK